MKIIKLTSEQQKDLEHDLFLMKHLGITKNQQEIMMSGFITGLHFACRQAIIKNTFESRAFNQLLIRAILATEDYRKESCEKHIKQLEEI